MKVSAGIVTYNPDLDKLKRNIDAVRGQVDTVYIFDNGSKNIDDIIRLAGSCKVIQSKKNVGIALALNTLSAQAMKDGSEWLLTLDQDSEVYPDIIEMYSSFTDSADSLTCYRKDRNINNTQDTDDLTDEPDFCITSGNLIRLSAWKAVGGFNNRLFIDMVDVDFCFRLKKHGYRILRLHKYGFLHEIGDGSYVKLFGKKHFTGNYSAFRKYYIFRNMSYIIRKYHLKKHYYSYKRLGMMFVSTLLFENDRLNKCGSAIKGFVHSFTKYKYLSEGADTRE